MPGLLLRWPWVVSTTHKDLLPGPHLLVVSSRLGWNAPWDSLLLTGHRSPEAAVRSLPSQLRPRDPFPVTT